MEHHSIITHVLTLLDNMAKKELQLFSHCGSFDHHALQSLNNCRFVFLNLPTGTLDILGLVIYRWKGIENIFPMVYNTPQYILNCSLKIKNIICNHYVTANQGGHKNRNEKTIAVPFHQVFY